MPSLIFASLLDNMLGFGLVVGGFFITCASSRRGWNHFFIQTSEYETHFSFHFLQGVKPWMDDISMRSVTFSICAKTQCWMILIVGRRRLGQYAVFSIDISAVSVALSMSFIINKLIKVHPGIGWLLKCLPVYQSEVVKLNIGSLHRRL